MLHRIWNLIVKELIQLWRDKLMVLFVLFGPLSELLMVAWSTSKGIEHLPTAVLDLDRSAASRGLIVAMANTETFDPYLVEALDQITQDVGSGRALAAWVIPPGFQAGLDDATGDPPPVQVIVDGADAMAAQTAASTAQRVIASYGQRMTRSPTLAGAGDELYAWLAEEGVRSTFVGYETELKLSYDFYKEPDQLVITDRNGKELFNTEMVATNGRKTAEISLRGVTKLVLKVESSKPSSKWRIKVEIK